MSSQMVPSTSVATNDSGRRWSLAYMDVTEPPSEFIVHQGQTINQLDLSNNRISDLRFLSEFPALTTLVLDHNRISSHVKIPRMPHLHTLWVNHNRIKNLGIFVSMLAYSCPNLQYLSMMNNEAAPSFFNGGTFSQYQDFRHFVISRLPKLQTLDYKTVTQEEREEAARIYGSTIRKQRRKSSKSERSSQS
ncbi:leucine-rich melanocyte differentiation-associated protein-like isoform X2 [Pomacea canaliculata]|uniref:leucine-rich melanocyte differentiation-associated protein-like isoform X2 n=1 Tax=Pomacea canaliculata TaxID=400727 RepID=UPI000D7265FB|nr:leucine-rich melanocyte differentiation-associated protein-like isoform X2 [Pomacea canaliculata]